MQNIKIPGWIPSLLLTVVPVLIIWFQGASESALLDASVAAGVVVALTTVLKLLEVFHPTNNKPLPQADSQSRALIEVTTQSEDSKLTRFLLG